MMEQRITKLEMVLLLQLVAVAPLSVVSMVQSMARVVSAVEALNAPSNISATEDGGRLPFSGSVEIRLNQRHS